MRSDYEMRLLSVHEMRLLSVHGTQSVRWLRSVYEMQSVRWLRSVYEFFFHRKRMPFWMRICLTCIYI
jgi:hypothetical protein